MAGDTTVAFRINSEDFDSPEEYEWFLEFHKRRENKSDFYRRVCLPKLKLTRIGKEDSFNKLMKLVDALGVDHILQCVDASSKNKGSLDKTQVMAIVGEVLKSVEEKATPTEEVQQIQPEEIIQVEVAQDIKTPDKSKTAKLLRLSQ